MRTTSRLDQVIGNLVVNAVKYTPESGSIRLALRREANEAMLRVADTGIGMHGGSARVASDSHGKGSEFPVRFPAVEPATAADAAPAATARDILIIEDNPDARDTLCMLLEILGHNVETAGDGLTGLEKALALQPEIGLVDIGLPGLDGYEIARRIRASHGLRQPYLVAITGYGTPEDRRRALDAGFDEHVAKPVDAETLAAILTAKPGHAALS